MPFELNNNSPLESIVLPTNGLPIVPLAFNTSSRSILPPSIIAPPAPPIRVPMPGAMALPIAAPPAPAVPIKARFSPREFFVLLDAALFKI